MRYLQFVERELDKASFKILYAVTSIGEDQKELKIKGRTHRLIVSNGQLHQSVSGSALKTIQIIGEGVRIVMKHGISPEIRDYLGDVWSRKEDWCTIAYSGTPGAMAAFKGMTEEQLFLFLDKVEILIRKILEEAPAVEKETTKRNLDELMESI